MMQHGQMVHDWYRDLLGPMNNEWDFGKVADLVEQIKPYAKDPLEMMYYHLYHDCGKPFCRTVDDDGRQHFPNHARVSHDIWLAAGGTEELAWFILHDMDFHTLKGADLDGLIHDSRAPSLLMTAWAELHANASMFGGTSSTSFKIKRKQLEKATRSVFAGIQPDFERREDSQRVVAVQVGCPCKHN